MKIWVKVNSWHPGVMCGPDENRPYLGFSFCGGVNEPWIRGTTRIVCKSLLFFQKRARPGLWHAQTAGCLENCNPWVTIT